MHPLASLLTYRAFLPDPLDIGEPVCSRFRQRKFLSFNRNTNRLLVVSAGFHAWRVAVATFDAAGAPTFSAHEISPSASNHDLMVDWLRSYAQKNKLEYVAVGIGHGFQVKALSAVARMPDVETMRLLRTEPSRLLDDTNLLEEVNSIVHHPDAENSCLRFTLRLPVLTQVRDVCNAAGLAIARIVCEQAQLMEMAYASGIAEKPANALLIALPSSYLLIPIDSSGWHSPLSDPAIDDQVVTSIGAAAEQAMPAPGGGTLLYIDAGMPAFEEVLRALHGYSPAALVPSTDSTVFQAIVLN